MEVEHPETHLKGLILNIDVGKQILPVRYTLVASSLMISLRSFPPKAHPKTQKMYSCLEPPLVSEHNIKRGLLHLSREKASCRGRDADVWILWWGKAEQPGNLIHHGVFGPWSYCLFELVIVSVAADQVKNSSGLVINRSGSKLNQRMRELQRWVNSYSSAGQQKLSGLKIKV